MQNRILAKTTRLYLMTVGFVLAGALAGLSQTLEPPPKPDDMVYVGSSACTDMASRIEGLCDMYAHADGSYYTAFYVDGKLMFIRKSVGDTYEDVWVHPYFNAIWKPKQPVSRWAVFYPHIIIDDATRWCII